MVCTAGFAEFKDYVAHVELRIYSDSVHTTT